MDTFDALRLFVSIAESGSLSAAARLESVATSTVTVALRQLEERSGATLIARSTRRLALTHEGHQFLSDARGLLRDWGATVMGERQGELKGPIKITASGEFGRKIVVPIVDQFVLLHPGVEINLHLADNIVELVDHHIDIALRAGPLPDSTLKSRVLLRGGAVVCAAPAYWKERGVPEHPEDLMHHNCLVHSRADLPSGSWAFLVDGKTAAIRVRGDRSANESEVLRHWANQGHGVLRRSVWGIQQDLLTGKLVTALDAYPVEDVANLYAVTTGGIASARVSALVDFLADELRAIDRPGY